MFRNFILALVFSGLASASLAADFPARENRYINDIADVIEPAREDIIRTMLVDVSTKHGIDFTVITINRMSDYGHNGAIEPFATGLFNNWGIGSAETNVGVMLLVARHDRRVRIELGGGYDRSYDARMKRVIDDVIVPFFKRDAYQTGITEGVDTVIHDLTGEWPPRERPTRLQKTADWMARIATDIGVWWSLAALPVFGFAFMAWRRFLRNRPRKCPVHEVEMTRVEEFADDEHLQEGQRLEERLDSVDYDVWRCDTCGHVTIESYKTWFSKFGACPQCNYRTLEGEETVLLFATTSHPGKKRIDYRCRHCAHEYSETRVIPRKSSSSSSSSSGGGGSSSGGGASGSW